MFGRAGSDVKAAFPVCWSLRGLAFLCLILLFHPLEGMVLAPVHWNSTNPIFKSSKNDHIIEVKAGDDIDFICPFYPGHDREGPAFEYYLIYSVSETEYKHCSLSTEATLILNCSQPLQKRRYTIIFQPHQSIPNAPEYKPGETYYYITTSTGRMEGLNNMDSGSCHLQNMRLMIRMNPEYPFFDDNEIDAENDYIQITETPKPPTRRHHHNKRPHMTRPPTYEDNQQPYIPRQKTIKGKGQEGNHRPAPNTSQKTHRRQTQKNSTSVSDSSQYGGDHHHQDQHRGSKQVSYSGGKQIFHYSQVPRSALSSTSGIWSLTSFPLSSFTIFGYHLCSASSVRV